VSFQSRFCVGTLGFTLAELLISLSILGVIATFTIPKIISSSQSGQKKAIALEGAAMVTGAYQVYLQKNSASSTVSIQNLTPYMNYVTADSTTTSLNDASVSGSIDCNPGNGHMCIRLHNGGTLLYNPGSNFGGTGPTQINWFIIDPVQGLSGPSGGDAARFALFYNGNVTSEGNFSTTLYSATGSYTQAPDPTWFAWP
jgi:prepilin-type N-terminal cleavage/methylation domain-containing protein